MNERIKELAIEAEFSEKDLHIQGDNFQKFAELLVNECANIAINKAHDIYAKAEKYAEDEDERTSAAATAWQFSVLAHELKNKFGVN